MKTLSIRQPWAELIIQGRKTLELRTWTVKYRGPLAIHASQTVARAACLAHGLDPDQVTTGAVVGVVDLADIEELDAASYAARQAEHLADEPFPVAVGAGLAPAQGQPQGPAPTLYGWRLANPRPLAVPAPMRGRMGLFEAPVADAERNTGQAGVQVDEETRRQGDKETRKQRDKADEGPSHQRKLATGGALPPVSLSTPSLSTSTRPFELRVLAVSTTDPGESAYRLALYQRLVEPPADQQRLYEPEPPTMRRVAELGGPRLRAVADYTMEALRTDGYKPTDLGPGRREPFALDEETGVRLGLLFLAVRPITKVDRIEMIAQGIRAMTSEEAYYWYSKCTGGPAAERAQRALRVLLADE
ncbi:MAG: hypothetical protein CVU38_14375 [Chloroflexi bacterium HGW-Chloroflexi-1]|nr:MAG: hypothetical protein CVU38_14375 [Chloroflexi bacterium HGW-Chloroflexi-1]